MNKYLYISNLLEFINVNKEFFLKTVAPSPQNLRYFISEDAPKRICAAFKQPSEIGQGKMLKSKHQEGKNLFLHG